VCDWVLARPAPACGGDNFAALIAAFGAEVDQPVADLMTSRLCSMTSRDAPPSSSLRTH